MSRRSERLRGTKAGQTPAETRRAKELKEELAPIPRVLTQVYHRTLAVKDGITAARRRGDPDPQGYNRATMRNLTKPRDTGKGGKEKVTHSIDESMLKVLSPRTIRMDRRERGKGKGADRQGPGG